MICVSNKKGTLLLLLYLQDNTEKIPAFIKVKLELCIGSKYIHLFTIIIIIIKQKLFLSFLMLDICLQNKKWGLSESWMKPMQLKHMGRIYYGKKHIIMFANQLS
jgi:hypothetical protein